ncbi:hypothetical protein PR001_g32406 [Phytophthora rubi]|uniref:Integrase catalytic domain-containing protein n=1 Tax=Phytophthora rubi TaxID=129364 RepID=A0A6A3G803_9STRA|nr:hypothetical protein PR001_g32406 [Phytophthora rubi]
MWAARYGIPKTLLSDQGTHFRNEMMRHMAARLKVEQNFTHCLVAVVTATVTFIAHLFAIGVNNPVHNVHVPIFRRLEQRSSTDLPVVVAFFTDPLEHFQVPIGSSFLGSLTRQQLEDFCSLTSVEDFLSQQPLDESDISTTDCRFHHFVVLSEGVGALKQPNDDIAVTCTSCIGGVVIAP